MKKLIITIDGPSGVGKSSAGRELARKLGYDYLDTGAMYRAFAFQFYTRKQHNSTIEPEKILSDFTICFRNLEGENRVFIRSEDVTEQIRKPEISMLASKLSALKPVRSKMTELQRQFGLKGGIIAEGRDMGTVVFPNADVKFFLSADLEIRADRRYRELSSGGQSISFNDVLQDIKCRDAQDSSREIAPLKPAHGAVKIDSTHLSLSQVVANMFAVIQVILSNLADSPKTQYTAGDRA